ncbi:MAG: DUF2007 domain-containing protein [Eubacterium sp.]|nr:DUF2007 domain-containing protein [Eubacterium sp.]
MVKVYTAREVLEANYIAQSLQTEGIECNLKEVAPLGLEIYVPEEEEALAMRILKFLQDEDERQNESVAIGYMTKKRRLVARMLVAIACTVLFSSVTISAVQAFAP